MDISSERIKIEQYNTNPNDPTKGSWSSYKLKIVAAQLVAQSSGYWIILVLIKGEDINGME